MCPFQSFQSRLLVGNILCPSAAMGSDVVDEGCYAMAKSSLGDDGVNEAHEDLGGVLVPKGHASIVEESQTGGEGSL